MVEIVVIGLLFLLRCGVGFVMDAHTCTPVSNPITFQVYQLECIYSGPGVYKYGGPSSVKTLVLNRFSDEAHLRIQDVTTELKEVIISSGSDDVCTYISVPSSVTVKVGEKTCVSKQYLEDCKITSPFILCLLTTPHP